MIYGDLTLCALSSGVTLRITTEKSSFTLTKQTLRRFRLKSSRESPASFDTNIRYVLQDCDIKTIGWGRIGVGRRFAFLAANALCVTTKIQKIERVWEGD